MNEQISEAKKEDIVNPDEIKNEVVNKIEQLINEIKVIDSPEAQQTYLEHIKKVISSISIEQMRDTYYGM